MSIKLKSCAVVLLLSACSDAALPESNSGIVQTPYILEAQKSGAEKFDTELSFITIYENNDAVCEDVKKGEGELQQFIYVGGSFLLQEQNTLAGEWEAQWASECDDG